MTTTKTTKKDDNEGKKTLITEEGLRKLQAELEELKTNGRLEVSKRLKEAISFGDLSENSEYDEAKNQQAFLEVRINELEEQLKNVEIIKDSLKKDEIQIGSKVTLQIVGKTEKDEFTIVGSTEADSIAHKISNESPVGGAILRKKKGDVVKVHTPGGDLEYKILDVN